MYILIAHLLINSFLYSLPPSHLQFEAWLETEHFGHPGLTDVGLQDVASAKFGIRGYCLGTEMHGFLVSWMHVWLSFTILQIILDITFHN